MKQGISLMEMAKEIQRQKDAKADYVVDTPCLEMEAVGGDVVMHLMEAPKNDTMELMNIDQMDAQKIDAVEPMNISQLAHRQIGTHLGIPSVYYDRMRANHPDLLAHNVNTYLQREPSRRILRTLDGDARAYLSDRYRLLDNYQILEAALPIIGEMPDVRIESCQITETRMYVKIVNPRIQTEVVPGDIVQAGIIISNSEVGLGSVLIQPLLLRLVCMNGMTVNDAAMRKTHLGRIAASDENYQLFTDKTLEADDKAFMLKVQDTVRAAADSAKFNMVVDMMREARDIPIETTNVPGFVKLASRDFKLSDEESDGVLNHLINGKDLSLYGLSNAVTRFSQDVDSYDRASELESIGYSVLAIDPKQWARYSLSALPERTAVALPAAS